ncbi:MAG: hypothetical protein K2I20_02015, partial [Clostridia bacterium]|nr:hypothetical protein [Clostridia bacterium]
MKGVSNFKTGLSKLSVVIYWIIFLGLAVLFFTNDFGLVDIHKTSIITAVGIDCPEEEVLVTAEVALPQPSPSGENIVYTQVQGSGLTIADALSEINAKTGFYPKLQFCKLILVGESCKDNELFRVLGCFYRKNYSELTALVAMCKGNAADMLAMKSNNSSMTSEAIRNVLSDEIKKSANANSANLKSVATLQYSQSDACFMPYVEAFKPGTSETGGNGENVGGEQSGQGGQGEQGGSSGGGSGESGGDGQSGRNSPSGGSGGSGEQSEPVEFAARQTAYFSGGHFKGVLDEQQSFALAVIQNDIRLAVLPCDSKEGIHYTLGLKSVNSGVKLNIEEGSPVVTFKFKADAQIQGARVMMEPNKIIEDDAVPKEVIDGAEAALKERMTALFETCKRDNADLLGLKEQLYKMSAGYFEAFKDDLLERAQIKFDIKIE